jgi:hypothetical protein
MVLMRRLTIEVDSGVAEWIERRKGTMRPEEFAARAIAEYRAADERATAVRMTRMHDEMSDRLDDLQERISRLNRSLKERHARQPASAIR